ncbi:MAG: exosortase A [Alphaproteobacteria bacterium]
MLLLGAIGLGGLFYDTASAMVRTWYHSSTFNHGFLILPIVAFLLWQRRDILAGLRPRPSYLGLTAVAGGAAAWLIGEFAQVLLLDEIGLVLMFQGLWFALFGWRITKAGLFPLAYLYFAVPFGDSLVSPLQDFTAVFATRALQLSGIPVLKDGVFITTPTGLFEVAEACAGLRFLIAMVALGVLFANLTYSSWWRRAAFMVLSLVVPVIANGIRAYGIILIAYLSDNRLAAGVDHIVYGWVFFSFVMIVLLAIGMTFQDRRTADRSSPPYAETPAAGGPAHRAAAVVAMGAWALLVAAAAPVYAAYTNPPGETLASVTLAPPQVSAPWRPAPDAGAPWRPKFAGVQAEIVQTFVAGDRRVHLYVGYYGHQHRGAELVAYGNAIADGRDWYWAESGGRTAQVENAARRIAYTRLVSPQMRPRLVWHWFWVGGRVTSSPYVAKALEIVNKTFGGRRDAAIVAVAADVQTSRQAAADTLQDFLDHLRLTGVTLGTGPGA